jgi:hypothetical protein
VKKRSNPARGALLAEVELALRPPRLLPFSAEQHAEAAELLSELLLAAVRRSARGSIVLPGGADDAEPSRSDVPAFDLGRGRLVA